MSELRVDNIVSEDGTTAPVYSKGMTIGAGQTLTCSGDFSVSGDVTFSAGANITGVMTVGVVDVTASGFNVGGMSTFQGCDFDGGEILREKVNITAGKLSDNENINLSDGMVHLFTTTETGISTANVRISASEALDNSMSTGDTAALTIVTTAAAAGYSTCVNIDGTYNAVKWLGGTAPSSGGSSGNDVYNFQIIKTGAATYTVLGSKNNFA